MEEHTIFSSFERKKSIASGDHMYDFLGCATRVSVKRHWAAYATPRGRAVNPSFPRKDEHYPDWIATLTAVNRASGTFRMAELGAGWAPWLVRAAMAAKQRTQISGTELVAIEANEVHYQWIHAHFLDNHLAYDAHKILYGAIASGNGKVRFPIVHEPDVNYGASIADAQGKNDAVELDAYSIDDIISLFSGPIDLLHMDIQGAEYDAIRSARSSLSSHVKLMLIGTHRSESLHDELAVALAADGWREVMNYARGRLNATPWGDIPFTDGLLVFENPALA